MKSEFTAIIEPAPEGGYWAICPEVPGANGQGETIDDELPAASARREERLATIEAALQRLEAQAKADAEADRQRTGKNRRGRAPKEGDETPEDKAQMSFTDPELKIMQSANKGWDYCGNAQASVDGAYQIVLACDVTALSNDKQQALPMAQLARANLERAGIERPQEAQGVPQKIPGTYDSGYYRAAAAEAVEPVGFDPYMATGRQRHHALEAEVSQSPETAKARMAAKVRTPEGRALYARRKVNVEPVFGQIKAVRGFRRFLLRGLAKIRGEWCLVCLTHKLLKLWRYTCVPMTA